MTPARHPEPLSTGGLPVDQLIAQTRSCRRFHQHRPLHRNQLVNLVDLARLSGSARNGQPWQYMIVNTPELCGRIFPFLGWAGYLSDWRGPEAGERPAAYILCFLNRDRLIVRELDAYFDLGIATQNLLLGAAARHILGCRIGAFSPQITDLFIMPPNLRLDLVIALGEPREQIVVEEMQEQKVAYWRDDREVHHVPKRSLADVLVDVPTR